MKTQISRWSDNLTQRRSGIYQQQGRMISDADWNELVELLKRRVDAALGDVIGTGTPRAGADPGLVAPGPMLRRGTVYIDGIRALLESATGTASFALNEQADFPGAPAWPGGNRILYADVWELATGALQDNSLLDPGLHGADTCTRTQTLVQVKWCAPGTDPLTDAGNPARGDASLALAIREGSSAPDPCDPCAAVVALDNRVGNYLFRVEVHDVQGPANAPTRITLKWSSENGAEQHAQANTPADFKRGDWIYEFYNDTTERHLGVHLAGFVPARAVLSDGWPEAADLPSAADYPYVRRWDGYCTLARSGTTWSLAGTPVARDKGRALEPLPSGEDPTHGHYTLASGSFDARLSGLRLTLALDDRRFVAGDYWLAAVREDAAEDERVQPATSTPLGITHHYIVLARVNGATVQAFTDAEVRRLSFPRLTDLTADRIGYNPAPKAARWTDIIDDGSPQPLNVQGAIDVLIDKLESSDIGYNLPTCTGVSTSVNQLITWPAGPLTVKLVLDTVLCKLDGTTLPYDAATGTDTVKDKLVALDTNKVNRAGDTMTGSLMIATGGLHVGGGSDPGSGNCVIEGNLTVKGTTTTISTTEVKIEDNIITVNAADAGGATAPTAGLEVQRAAAGIQAQLLWREPESRWTLGVAGQTRQVSVSATNNYALLAEQGRIGQLESGTFGDGWGKWIALGTPNLGFVPTDSTYYGVKVQWDSDAVVFGLKDYGANRKDAIIAWGDDPNDNLRFLKPDGADAMVVNGAGNVGIGMEPYTQLSLAGPIGFSNAATPLMYIFQSGTGNATRALFAHSSAFPGYGMFYRDTDDTVIFQQSDTAPALSVDLVNRRVGVRTADPSVELDVAGTVKANELRTTLYTLAPTGSAALSTSNAWAAFPGLTQTISVPRATNVLIFYQITMAGTSVSHLVTRIAVDGVAQNHTRAITGDTVYWSPSNFCFLTLSAGSHTVAVQYRTPAGGTNNPGGTDWNNRVLQVLVLGSA